MCEVLNRQLVDGRDKPIVTCLEYMRVYFMRRIVNVQNVIDKTEGLLTPAATKILERLKKEASEFIVEWNGAHKYEVKGPWAEQHVVDMLQKQCTCRRWELTGIPCKHVIAVIWKIASESGRVQSPESLVHTCYRLDTWKKVYSFKLNPITGTHNWPKSTCPLLITPPIHHIQPGRPKKKRKRAAEEQSRVRDGKLRKIGTVITCSKCKQTGHNARGCKVGEEIQATAKSREIRCSICKCKGHNSRGCKGRVDEHHQGQT